MRLAARWLLALTAAANTLACGDDVSARPLINSCTQAFECKKPTRCDTQLGFCVRDTVDRPYPMVVRVTPPDDTLSRTLSAERVFDGGTILDAIKIRRAINVSGDVVDSRGLTVSAEVAFVPQANNALTGGVSAFTQPVVDAADAGAQPALPDGGPAGPRVGFSTTLEPSTAYDVRVYPIGLDSQRLPPRAFTFDTSDSPQITPPFQYPSMTTRAGSILDENKQPPPAGSTLRLRDKVSGDIVSSIGTPSGARGTFDLDAPGNVLSALNQLELVLDVPVGDVPQSVSIVFDATLLDGPMALVMPVVPAPVLYSFSVEVADSDARTVNADMTFVSSFPLPTQTNDVRGRDWCRLRLPGSVQGTFTCNAEVKTSVVGRTGAAKLLPGDYQVFVSPNGDVQDPQRVATYNRQENIEQQDGGAQSGSVFGLQRAATFLGTVASPQKQPMPGVTVTANALGIVQDLPEVARYNRTTEQVSGGDGTLLLAVDTGYYDLVGTPPPGTNFTWVLLYNRRISVGGGKPFNVLPQTPVIARGTVFSEAAVDGGSASALGNARIEAFAIVDDLGVPGGTRAVRIASTSTDDHGDYALAMPPYIGDPPTADVSDGGVDTASALDLELDLDAGL